MVRVTVRTPLLMGGNHETKGGSMTNHDDKVQGSTSDQLHGPSDEVLRASVRHDNGDLTIQGAAGRIRLVNGSDAWKRYNGYLEARNIDPNIDPNVEET